MPLNLSTKTLPQLKRIVDKNLDSSIECGLALREIRDRKLWLEECGSFQEFCELNWKVSKTRAYQLIDYVDIVGKLPPEASTSVDSEAVARALKKVPEKDREAVIEKAKQSGKVSAPAVARAAKSMNVEVVEILDATGFQIPEESPAMKTWERSEEIQESLTALSRIKSRVEKAFDDKDPMYSEINFSSFVADITSARQLFKVAMPYAVCPTCQGRVLSQCATCKGRGMVSEHYWKRLVPEETRNIRLRAIAMRKKK